LLEDLTFYVKVENLGDLASPFDLLNLYYVDIEEKRYKNFEIRLVQNINDTIYYYELKLTTPVKISGAAIIEGNIFSEEVLVKLKGSLVNARALKLIATKK
jgi:disulfide oxidoreductase YuzD